MLETLIKIGLGPLLIVQGIYARKNTPKLPEASGEREGCCGNGQSLGVLIVGDSAAAGVGTEQLSEALPGHLLSHLKSDYQVSWQLLAQSGFDTADALAMLSEADQKAFDVAIISLGVNDVKGLKAVELWIDQLQQLMTYLQQQFSVKHVLVSAVPPMHAFTALPQPLRWYMGFRAKRFNQCLQQLLSEKSDCSLLVADFPINADFLAADGFHPSARAYAVWAEEANRMIRQLIN